VAISGADGAQLHGWQFTPARPNGHSAVLLHGIVDNRASTLGLARLLLRHGYRTLTVDARAHGESGGPFATFGVREADDLRRWIASARGSDDQACVYALGRSLGAAHALGASDAPALCGIVAESGFASLREITFDRIGQQAGTGSWLGRSVFRLGLEFAFLYTRARYGVDFGVASAAGAVAGPGAPILLIHGTADDNVPVRHARLIHAANSARVTLWLVPGAGHGNVWKTAALEYPARVTGFLATHRRPSRQAATNDGDMITP
jgi:pimeloyl-ACP methyl ester carboxylesterase